jgi:hypothetical protein
MKGLKLGRYQFDDIRVDSADFRITVPGALVRVVVDE